MPMSDMGIVARSIQSRLLGSGLSVLTVAVACALLLVMLSMRDAGRRSFERGASNAHLIVSRDASPLSTVLNTLYYASNPPRSISMAEVATLEAARTVRGVPLGALTAWVVPVQTGDSFRGRPVVGVGDQFFEVFEPVQGTPWAFATGGGFAEPFDIVIGADVAATARLAVGDRINVSHGSSNPDGTGGSHIHDEFDFTVTGILEPTGTAHDRTLFMGIEDSWTMHAHDRRLVTDPTIPPSTREDVTDADRVATALLVRTVTREGGAAGGSVLEVFEAIRRHPLGLVVASPGEELRKLFTIIGGVDQILVGLAAAVLVAGSISIMVALVGGMEQRRRQIAVLRVLGASRGRIFGLVMTESALLSMLGAAAGVVLSLFGVRIVADAVAARTGLVIEPDLSPQWMIAVAGGTVVLGVFAGLVPAVMAYRTSVANRLRPIG